MEQKILNIPVQERGPSLPAQPRAAYAPPASSHAQSRLEDMPTRRRSLLLTVGKWLYRMLVAVSAVIVGGYLLWNLFVRPPTIPMYSMPDLSPIQTGLEGGGQGGQTQMTPRIRRPGVFNVLLAATDLEGVRTDTMMVMSYDVTNQKVGVVSIPRDTLVNRVTGNPKLVYGTGGVLSRCNDISDLLGIPLDYYIKVDITGFIALVDYVGGVDFYVPCDMNYDDPYQNLYVHYTQGQYHLSGQQAMEVARFRKNNDGSGYSDVGRTQTQQKILIALAKKVLEWGSLSKINGFVKLFDQYVKTDLSLSDMLYFASQAIYLDPSNDVETLTLTGNGSAVHRGYTYCYALDKAAAVDAVNRLINPYDRDLTLDDMNIIN